MCTKIKNMAYAHAKYLIGASYRLLLGANLRHTLQMEDAGKAGS